MKLDLVKVSGLYMDRAAAIKYIAIEDALYNILDAVEKIALSPEALEAVTIAKRALGNK